MTTPEWQAGFIVAFLILIILLIVFWVSSSLTFHEQEQTCQRHGYIGVRSEFGTRWCLGVEDERLYMVPFEEVKALEN